MNRKSRRKWLRKPEFKKEFSNKERRLANNLIVNIQTSSRKMEEQKNLKETASQKTGRYTTEGLTVESLSHKLKQLIK